MRDDDAEAIADLFAAHAAIALGQVRQREGLQEALHSRKIIGQAVGILMERYQIDDDRAFNFLLRTSSHANIKLRDVAARLADGQRLRLAPVVTYGRTPVGEVSALPGRGC